MRARLLNVYNSTRQIVKDFEESPFVRLFAIVALVIVPYQFWQGIEVNRATLAEIRAASEFRETERTVAERTLAELQAAALIREEEAAVRVEEARARAWALLTARAPGNSGKVPALEYLAREERSLAGIDMSCTAMGGVEDGRCLRETYLQHLDVSVQFIGKPVRLYGANFSGTDLTRAKFTRAELNGALFKSASLTFTDFRETDLTRADFSGATFQKSDFSRADLIDTDFSGAFLYQTDFSGAVVRATNFAGASLYWSSFLDADMMHARFQDANLSKVTFPVENRLNSRVLRGSWAWVDEKPVGLGDLLADVTLCEYKDVIVSGPRARRGLPDDCKPRLGSSFE